MAKKKLSGADVAELRAAYEAWNPHDPDSITADELAAQFGISKQSLYSYRERWLEEDRRMREREERKPSDQDAAEAIMYLTTELVKAKTRIAELERELEALRSPDRIGN